MSTTRLLLVRHAEVEARYQHVFGGRVDMEISPQGQAQATALAAFLQRKRLDAIYASPMKRVQQTLVPLLNNGASLPVTVAELCEIDFGDWTGFGWDALQQKFGVNAYAWLEEIERGAVPNGESGAVLRARIEPCLRQIIATHAGQTVAVFCHGGVIRMMLSILLELPLPKTGQFEIAYASVTRVALHAHRTELELLNFTPWRDPNP